MQYKFITLSTKSDFLHLGIQILLSNGIDKNN